MRYVGDVPFKYWKNPNGNNWQGTSRCSTQGCGADASATSANAHGPYTGSCSNGHPIHINNVRAKI